MNEWSDEWMIYWMNEVMNEVMIEWSNDWMKWVMIELVNWLMQQLLRTSFCLKLIFGKQFYPHKGGGHLKYPLKKTSKLFINKQ